MRARRSAPEGAPDFDELTVSLKRYPDTKLDYFCTMIRNRECFFIWLGHDLKT
jgi:hypothetical protein